jgi:hypothetical protein
VVQLTIVGDQQRPVVSSSSRPIGCTSRSRRARQQFEDAGVMLRLARAFVAGRLVEHQGGEFGVGPIDAVDREDEVFNIDFDERIVANLAIDRDTFVPDK